MASLADETPEGRSIVVLAKERFNIREHELHGGARAVRAVHGADPHERGRRRGQRDPQGRGRRDPRLVGPGVAAGTRRGGGPHLARRRHPARRRQGPRPDGRGRAEGHHQGGLGRAVRPAAPDGHPHGHDHRRQPAHRRRDRAGIRRRRLPRRGHARNQDGADQEGAGGRRARRDDRRRHERRPRARPGRRRRRDEHRHARPRRRPATWSTSTRTRRS